MPRIHVLSDLHMQAGWAFGIKPVTADMVILAGDIGNGVRGVKWAKATFPADMPVIYVPGNHEYYDHTMQDMLTQIRDAASGSNIHVLDRDSVTLCGVRVLGATLWTDYGLFGDTASAMLDAAGQMNDHRLIRYNDPRKGGVGFTPKHAHEAHQRARMYIRHRLRANHAMPTIVVTHHAPSRQSVHPMYQTDPITPAFASDLDLLIRLYGPALWVHGHTHSSFDYMLGKTRVLCNPRGYEIKGSIENAQFNPNLVVEI